MKVGAIKSKSKIDWEEAGRNISSHPCPVCGRESSTVALRMVHDDISLIALWCKCGSLFYPEVSVPDYAEIEKLESFLMRIDQAEGVDSIIRSLLFSPDLEQYPVVDLGCGIGFAVDYLNFVGRYAQGFDPSTSSRISHEKFGIDIKGLPSKEEIGNFPHPNLIFASEVIEHVPNPRAFMGDIKMMAEDDGYVLLTTPNANYVIKENSEITVMSILAPSQHLFLLSPGAIEDLAREAGFVWVKSWVEEERLFLVAGPRPIRIENTFSQEAYERYLEDRLLNADWIEKSLRWRCFGYRLFKHRIHRGDYENTRDLWEGLVSTYRELGLSLDRPVELVQQYRAELERTGARFPTEKFPFNASILLFLQGTYLVAYKQDMRSARPYFDGAVALSKMYAESYKDSVFQMYDREIAMVPEWTANIIRGHWKYRTGQYLRPLKHLLRPRANSS
jgi:SAM-dependent methyltransferase